MKWRREREQQLEGWASKNGQELSRERIHSQPWGSVPKHQSDSFCGSGAQTQVTSQFPLIVSKLIKGKLCLPTSCPNTKHVCCVLPYCVGGGERSGTWRVRCPHDVTNNEKDLGLSSPRFHSEIRGYSRAVIHDMLPPLIDLK